MRLCDCYKAGRCVGTREIDPCNCEGNRTKCDFYPSVRASAVEHSPLFLFGDVVVCRENQIGVVVKTWQSSKGCLHEVYVRSTNQIEQFPEDELTRYCVRHKVLTDEEFYYQWGRYPSKEDT